MQQSLIPAPFLGKVRVLPQIPKELEGLEELSYNLWWAWNPNARALFRSIHEPTWIKSMGNPVRFMSLIHQNDLNNAAKSHDVMTKYKQVMDDYKEYMSGKNSWYTREYKKRGAKKELFAYFSAEFGLHECLPIYSGGLGVLAGDHCKSASDIGIPFVAVGLLYREGYFVQRINAEGQQVAEYPRYSWSNLPVRPVEDVNGNPAQVTVEITGRHVHAKVWKVQVGRISLYLLDTDIEANNETDRRITARLYGGGEDLRIQQEILLGIGGVRALRTVGLQPTVFHMNEGHSVFLGLERIREYIHNHGLNFDEALELVRSTTLFTTHTPVPAGNDAFPPQMMENYFRSFWESLSISRNRFMTLGLDTAQTSGRFSLTILALNLTAMTNGVSELHGHVSRSMWQHVWSDVPFNENPIQHITNGVHTRTWMSIDMQNLFDQYFKPDWREHLTKKETWEQCRNIPDEVLWDAINKLREDMIHYVHRTLQQQHERFGESPDVVSRYSKVFHPKALTVGFARRFATYKRATLIFRDKERLARILNNPDRPIQIAFAGKAHPADIPGQELIKAIKKISEEPAFHGKVVLIENYDMNVGRRITSGVDVWLNNPRRPLEASGTSGMKVPLNGGVNCSILDGWWVEAYRDNPLSGFALGDPEKHYATEDLQDAADAESIYHMLENVIAPIFFDRDEKGIPREWLRRVRESMITVGPQFSTNRMVQDYATLFYFPGSERHTLLEDSRFERARNNSHWKNQLRAAWPNIQIHACVEEANALPEAIRVTDKINIVAYVDLGTINPNDVQVEIFVAQMNGNPENLKTGSVAMRPDGQNEHGRYIYRGSMIQSDSGEYGYTVRVVPRHPDLVHPNEMGLVSWAHTATANA
ncbi:MAG: alpha-glucan family phosphorylase [Candidatus Sumerlaeia bacterium]|nr:alpha-glucan family phosphorylase [Candidatus Sumerlaeia bacterium]